MVPVIRGLRAAFQSNWTFAATSALVLFWTAAHLWPASWWFSVERVVVFDAPAGASVVMQADRTIRRPFAARWHVLVRRATPTGWGIVCAASGGGDYRPDATLPDPLTLHWWTNGQCPMIQEPGQYMVSTIWTISAGITGDKRVLAESNIFTVTESGE